MSITYEQPRQDAPSDFQRIYVGSLDYFAKPADVESLLQEAGLDHKKIHISIDPISGRNPGYCFVEFGTHEEAANSLDQLAGKTLLGRTVKLGPCVPKNQGHHNGGARLSEHRQTFQRWGDWKGDGNSRQLRDEQGGQGPYAAMERVETYQPNKDGFRVRVDGLDKMVDQLQNDEEIRGLFEGFEVVAIGKRVIPHSLRGTPGNHHHCFVDLATKEEADRAVAELNGFPFEDGHLKVSLARSNQNHRSHQPRDNRGPQRSDNNQGEQQERRQPPNFERRNQIMEAKSWR